jgi:hypothetical protein
MKHETQENHAARQRNGECNRTQNQRIDEFGKMSLDLERNWAWTTSSSRYDWMDSHAPFAYLD